MRQLTSQELIDLEVTLDTREDVILTSAISDQTTGTISKTITFRLDAGIELFITDIDGDDDGYMYIDKVKAFSIPAAAFVNLVEVAASKDNASAERRLAAFLD